MKILTIIMTTDENYIIPTKTAIYSMLLSAGPDISFEIHILCEKGFSEENRDDLRQLELMDSRLKIIFEEIESSLLEGAKTLAHIPVASYYRLFISRFIKGDRCLFVDGDVIVRTDLGQIYDTDLDGYYIAGVRDCAAQTKKAGFVHHEEELEIENMDQYVNAGFMLFNLNKIREDGLDTKLIEGISAGYRFMDQDILNKYCFGKIKHLPLKYNLFSEYYHRIDKMGETCYSAEELKEADEKAGLLHYTGTYKPWLCTRLTVNKIWWEYAGKVLSAEELTKIKEDSGRFERESDWSYILDRAGRAQAVVIFGFFDLGMELADRFPDSIKTNVIFVDKDTDKQGKTYHNMDVYSLREGMGKYPDALWIICSQGRYKEIRTQLYEMGIREEKIIRYIYKTREYYEGLSKEYVEYESEMVKKNR